MSITKDNLPYSVHSFMLPFRWDYLPEGFSFDLGREYFSFEERTDLKQFLHCLLDGHSRWKRKFYCIDGKKEKYNEFHYFHSYVAKTIFDLQQPDEKTEDKVNPNKVMVYFQYNTDVDTDTFHIHTAKKNDGGEVMDNSYTLAIREISLHVYNTGVAILGIHLNNNKYREKEQVCRINEFGRRLYPQFLNDGPKATEKVKEAFLPLRVEMFISGAPIMEDDFSEYDAIDNREVYHYDNKRTEYQRTWVTQMPQYIRKLFGNKFAFSSREYVPDAIALNVLTDDRMFFMCWHGNDQFASEMTDMNLYYGKENKKCQSVAKEKKEYSYLSNDCWYAYMHGDKGQPNIDNPKMLRKLSKKYTYARWAGRGKLFGITMGSFVALSRRLPHVEDEGRPDICTKMKNVYCQMAVLCLAQRISLLRFSAEIANLAEVTRTEENKRLVGNIKILYRNYIEFVNKVYYLEITPVISGIELYKQFHKVMEIAENLHEIESEIDNLFNYARLTEAEVQSDEAYKLNKVASLFLPASFLASLLGISFNEISEIFPWHPVFDWLLIIGIGCLISYIILKFIKKRET